jgi:hypothetical protein
MHLRLSCVIDVAFDRSILFNDIISWFSTIFSLDPVSVQCQRQEVHFLLHNGGGLEHHLCPRNFFPIAPSSPMAPAPCPVLYIS